MGSDGWEICVRRYFKLCGGGKWLGVESPNLGFSLGLEIEPWLGVELWLGVEPWLGGLAWLSCGPHSNKRKAGKSSRLD
ncbi:hypothetical protein CDL15_Pgr024810 [Punica granatum]|uniref:Uncharacterized protein n=1 Tax=Punica granatum TaxID=22663 RepID=A0A218WJR1_PUNGR|nr:hypothetical protein CDL15_Pgr024810 [Punica granatum]